MAKTQFNKLVVSYVAAVRREGIQNMFSGRYSMQAVPDGAQHIFEVNLPGTEKEELSARSFCGLAKGDIGENTKVYKDRQPGGGMRGMPGRMEIESTLPVGRLVEG